MKQKQTNQNYFIKQNRIHIRHTFDQSEARWSDNNRNIGVLKFLIYLLH